MAQVVGAGPKSRSSSGFAGQALNAIDRRLVSTDATKGLNNELLSQFTEALRTGGIGAQIPIVQQSVSEANRATSDTLRQTEDSLARSGLSRTPYGQAILSGTRMQGNQAAAQIPTNYAQQFISQAPQFTGGILEAILGAARNQRARSGPYNT